MIHAKIMMRTSIFRIKPYSSVHVQRADGSKRCRFSLYDSNRQFQVRNVKAKEGDIAYQSGRGWYSLAVAGSSKTLGWTESVSAGLRARMRIQPESRSRRDHMLHPSETRIFSRGEAAPKAQCQSAHQPGHLPSSPAALREPGPVLGLPARWTTDRNGLHHPDAGGVYHRQIQWT